LWCECRTCHVCDVHSVSVSVVNHPCYLDAAAMLFAVDDMCDGPSSIVCHSEVPELNKPNLQAETTRHGQHG
jgi:hypothetical protein